MKENESDNKKRKKLILDTTIIVIIVAIIAIVIFLLTYRRETHIKETYDDGDTSALVCTSYDNDSEVAFFSSDIVTKVKHTVKLVYNNNKLSKMSYEYDGDYKSEAEAKEESGRLHTKYNLYLGDRNVKHEILAPVFQFSGTRAMIRLYLDDYKNMNQVINTIFYIGNGMIETVGKNTPQETKKLYEDKGFSCIISN